MRNERKKFVYFKKIHASHTSLKSISVCAKVDTRHQFEEMKKSPQLDKVNHNRRK
jgi:hypothetical protein